MSAYVNEIRSYIERFKREVCDDALIDPHRLAEWAYRNGLYKPSARTVIDAIASDIAQVFREEYRTDRQGPATAPSMRLRARTAIAQCRYGLTWTTPTRHTITSFGHSTATSADRG